MNKTLHTTLLRMLDVFPRDLAIAVDIARRGLTPSGRNHFTKGCKNAHSWRKRVWPGTAAADNLVECAGSKRRDHLDDAVLASSTREAEFTLRVTKLAQCSSGDVDGQTCSVAEYVM